MKTSGRDERTDVGCSASGVQSDDLVTRLQRNLQSKCVTKGAEIAAERSIEISEPRRFGEFLFGTGTPRGVFVAKKNLERSPTIS